MISKYDTIIEDGHHVHRNPLVQSDADFDDRQGCPAPHLVVLLIEELAGHPGESKV